MKTSHFITAAALTLCCLIGNTATAAAEEQKADDKNINIEKVLKKARERDKDAMIQLINCYRDGIGVEQDGMKAILALDRFCDITDQDMSSICYFVFNHNPALLKMTEYFAEMPDKKLTEKDRQLISEAFPNEIATIGIMQNMTEEMLADPEKSLELAKSLLQEKNKGSVIGTILYCAVCKQFDMDLGLGIALVCAERIPLMYEIAAHIYITKAALDYTQGIFEPAWLKGAFEALQKADKSVALTQRTIGHFTDMISIISQDVRYKNELKKYRKTLKRMEQLEKR